MRYPPDPCIILLGRAAPVVPRFVLFCYTLAGLEAIAHKVESMPPSTGTAKLGSLNSLSTTGKVYTLPQSGSPDADCSYAFPTHLRPQ